MAMTEIIHTAVRCLSQVVALLISTAIVGTLAQPVWADPPSLPAQEQNKADLALVRRIVEAGPIYVTRRADLPEGITIDLKGTGLTTGHVLEMTVRNATPAPIMLDLPPALVATRGANQSFVVPRPTRGLVTPFSTQSIPIGGYCTDGNREPTDGPVSGSWYSAGGHVVFGDPPDGVGPGGTDGGGDGDGKREFPETRRPLPRPLIPVFPDDSDNEGKTVRDGLTPGEPIDDPYDQYADPARTARLLIPAVREAERAYDRLKASDRIRNPIPMTAEQQRQSFVQQTLWLYTALFREDDPRTVEDIERNLTDQIAERAGIEPRQIPEQHKKQIEQGANSIFDSVVLVGVEAKILEDPVAGAGERGRTTATSMPTNRRCVRWPYDLDNITDWEPFHHASIDGKIEPEYHFFQRMRRKAIAYRLTAVRISQMLSLYEGCCGFDCAEGAGMLNGEPRPVPPLPDLSITLDTCSERARDATRLGDLFTDADFAKIAQWQRDVEAAVDNLGVEPPPAGGAYVTNAARLDADIDRAMDNIERCATNFRNRFNGWAELSYNQAEAEGKFWSGLITVAAFAAAPLTGGGSLAATYTVAFATTISGVVVGMGVEALSGDSEAGQIASAIIGLATSGNIAGAVVSASASATSAAVGEAYNSAAAVSITPMIVCDKNWQAMKRELLKNYTEAAVARLEDGAEFADGSDRNTLKACVCENLRTLCRVRNLLNTAAGQIQSTLDAAHEQFKGHWWRHAYRDALETPDMFDCCCEHDDGTTHQCVLTFPAKP